MNLIAEMRDGTLVITAGADRIDAACAVQFKDRMRELTQNASSRILLNLEHVNFVDSSGLGAIVGALKQLPLNGTFELAALTPAVDKVFRLTRMDSVFAIHMDTDAAFGEDRQTG